MVTYHIISPCIQHPDKQGREAASALESQLKVSAAQPGVPATPEVKQAQHRTSPLGRWGIAIIKLLLQ